MVENERLVFTWRWIDGGVEQPAADTVTSSFEETVPDGSLVRIVHPTNHENAEAYETGWRDTLSQFDRGLAWGRLS